MRPLSRRRFVYVMAGFGTSIGAVAALRRGFDIEPNDPSIDDLQQVHRTSWALGSNVAITALHRDAAVGESAIAAAFEELELIEDVMSIYREDSQLSRLNRNGLLDDPHPHLVAVLQTAQSISARTEGAFDVTVQPLWELYSRTKQLNRLPTETEIATARQNVDWKRLEVEPSRIRLDGNGTAITLNGIAQGYAADRVTAVLQKHGVSDALIDTGEFGTLGTKAGGDPWRVGIQHPREQDAYVSVAQLAGRCLATSGDYATTFTDDHRHHHLLDPRTGRSPNDLSSVSIVATTAMAADALSTAVFVMGSEAGLKLVEQTPGADALLVQKDGTSTATAGFPCLQA